MPVDPELLEILVCPKSKGQLEVVALPEEVRTELVEKYRSHFRDEEPEVEEGLFAEASSLVYPIVSDIPIMLIDEALPASVIGR
ncbi:MAG: Trm112 family protein [Acidobacteriota bacterium]